jgi:acetolactate synthase-1/2/3 large subunit
MNVAQTIADILRAEGAELLFCYPTNRLIEEAAMVGIRPLVVRQERTGVHMADAWSRLRAPDAFGVFAMQHGPGAENSVGAIAQAYAESVPILIVAQGYPRRLAGVAPNFRAAVSMTDITKSAEALSTAPEVANVFRRAFSKLRNGRPGPVLVEVPQDLWAAEIEAAPYTPAVAARYRPSDDDVTEAVRLITAATSPVIYAGQGVHYARAWPQLLALAETIGSPVATTLAGKSAFPEDHPLALGAGGLAYPDTVKRFLQKADLIIGVGCSFAETVFAVELPAGPKVIHMTVDPSELDGRLHADVALVGDAALGLEAVLGRLGESDKNPPPIAEVGAGIRAVRERWLANWGMLRTTDAVPLSPYRVLANLMEATREERSIITHDAGRPRDQLSPFWVASEPQSYLGWGKSTQLGYGLGLAMGAKLAYPDRLCINVWGDAAIGFTGTDLETAVRERIAILSILLNNGGMATEANNLPYAIERYRATEISGDYSAFARALGAYSERVEAPDEILPALRRGVEHTKRGVPVLLEFMTSQETRISQP